MSEAVMIQATMNKWGLSLPFCAIPEVIQEFAGGVITSNAGYKAVMLLARFLLDPSLKKPEEMDKPIARVSQARLASRLKVSVAAVKKTLAKLKEEGLISYEQPKSDVNGEFKCNKYDLSRVLELCREAAADEAEEGPEIRQVDTAPEIRQVAAYYITSLSLNRNKDDDDITAPASRIASIIPFPEKKEWNETDARTELAGAFRAYFDKHGPDSDPTSPEPSPVAEAWNVVRERMIKMKNLPRLNLNKYVEKSISYELEQMENRQEARESRPAVGGSYYTGQARQRSSRPASGRPAMPVIEREGIKRDEYLDQRGTSGLDAGHLQRFKDRWGPHERNDFATWDKLLADKKFSL